MLQSKSFVQYRQIPSNNDFYILKNKYIIWIVFKKASSL